MAPADAAASGVEIELIVNHDAVRATVQPQDLPRWTSCASSSG